MLYGKSTTLIIQWRTIELEQWKESLDQWITPPTMHTATRRVSRKAKGSRSLKYVDRLMRLLPFICPFKSSDLKASLLLLGYLLMTFVCDVMIRVSFEVHFPICMFLRFGKAGWDCVKKGYIFMCARYFFFVFKYTVSPAAKKKKTEIRFSKPYSRYSLFFKRIRNSVRFFYQTLSVTNLVLGGVTLREPRICIGNHMILSAIWN